MTIYGYARVSTKGQAKDGNSLESQNIELKENGAIKVYSDAFTGTKTSRPELDRLKKVLIPGDVIMVTKFDRIARNIRQGLELIEELNHRGVAVHVLNIGRIDDTPTGRLLRNVMLAFAEFERDMIVQRTQEGKAIAKRNPNFKEGRPKKYTTYQMEHALELCKTKSISEVVRMTGISRSTILRAHKEK